MYLVDNIGQAIGSIGSMKLSLVIQKLFPLPASSGTRAWSKMWSRSWNHDAISYPSQISPTSGLMAANLNFSSMTMSNNVCSVLLTTGMIQNMGQPWKLRPSVVVQQLFPLLVLSATIVKFSSQPMSDNALSVKSKSGMIENMVVAIRIASLSLSIQKLFPVPVCDRPLELVVNNVEHCWPCHIQVGHGRTCGDHHWNYVNMLLKLK